MNWFISLFRGGMFTQQRLAPNRKMFRRGAIMSLLALAGGAVAVGAARRNGDGGNLFQKIMQPFRLFR